MRLCVVLTSGLEEKNVYMHARRSDESLIALEDLSTACLHSVNAQIDTVHIFSASILISICCRLCSTHFSLKASISVYSDIHFGVLHIDAVHIFSGSIPFRCVAH